MLKSANWCIFLTLIPLTPTTHRFWTNFMTGPEPNRGPGPHGYYCGLALMKCTLTIAILFQHLASHIITSSIKHKHKISLKHRKDFSLKILQ